MLKQKQISGAAYIAALFFLCALTNTACTPRPKEHLFAGSIMGTEYHVKCVDETRSLDSVKIEASILGALKRIDGLMSTYKPESELSRFNTQNDSAPFALSAETFEVFDISQQLSKASGGAFDISVGPIVNAYGFGPDMEASSPSDAELEALRPFVGYGLLELNAQTSSVSKKDPRVYCDLSAVAKGYAVDKVAEALDSEGITNYMVEVGGEVRVFGHNVEGKPWRIAIESPAEESRTVYKIVPMGIGETLSMATSGDYRNFYMQDGVRISHTIDPRTGKSISHNLASVSVLHKSCAWADAYATTLMVLGADDGMRFAEEQGIAAYMIVRVGDTFESRQSAVFPNIDHSR